jgi:hypothetical protein
LKRQAQAEACGRYLKKFACKRHLVKTQFMRQLNAGRRKLKTAVDTRKFCRQAHLVKARLVNNFILLKRANDKKGRRRKRKPKNIVCRYCGKTQAFAGKSVKGHKTLNQLETSRAYGAKRRKI